MANTNTKNKQAPAKTLSITRIFDAPVELVWKVWTDPKHLAQWWGPNGFTNPVCEIDVTKGGNILIHMKGPDGTVYPMNGQYREIIKHEKLVFTSAALDANNQPLFEILNTFLVSKEGNKTKFTMTAEVSKVTSEAAPYLAGMDQGWNQSLDRLSTYLLKIK